MAGLERINSPAKVQRIGNDSVYGTGSDGTVVIASSTSLTRDMYYSSLTINVGAHLNTNGYRVFVKNQLTLNGNIGSNSTQTVSTGTLSGQQASATANIAQALGGNSAGNTRTASQITDSDKKNLEFLISGIVIDAAGTVAAIKGGAGGIPGTPGVLTPATAGGAGSLTRNAGVAGGPGTAGTTPGISVGGTGSSGGPIVLIVAKTIVGSGVIMAQGKDASLGQSNTTGSAGSAASNATLTHLTDNSAHYITGDGTTGPHASIAAPALPHGPSNTTYQNTLIAFTHRYVHVGNVHGQQYTFTYFPPADNPGHTVSPPYSHNYDYVDNTPHVNTLTALYYNINGIAHNHAHRNQPGVSYTYEFSQTASNQRTTNSHASNFTTHTGLTPQDNHLHHPTQHHDHDSAHFRKRDVGTISSQGSVVYPGGAAGAAGSSTAGASGVSGGGGGIIIVTDSIANTVVTSVVGGTVSGGGTGQSGTVLTILNQ